LWPASGAIVGVVKPPRMTLFDLESSLPAFYRFLRPDTVWFQRA
jgi:hypothetical protein